MSTARPSFSSLSVASNIERHRIASDKPWLYLLDLEYPGDGLPSSPPAPNAPPVVQTHIRFVRDYNPFTFDAGDGLGPQEYSPFNFAVGDLTQASNGAVPDMELHCSNVLRALQGVIEQVGGLVGANLTIFGINLANPAGEPDLTLAFTIKSSSCDAKLVTFKLGASSPLRRLFPVHMYRPNFCNHDYNSPALQAAYDAAIAAGNPPLDPPGLQCGYRGPLTTCSKTIDGPNGCQAHFPDAVLRILTFPGIDSNGSAAAGVV